MPTGVVNGWAGRAPPKHVGHAPCVSPAPRAQPARRGGTVPFAHPGLPISSRQETRCASTAQTSEAYKTFTNPDGRVLRRLAEDVWAAERPFIWNGIDVNGRMAVLRLSDGGLWVHSPVEHDAAMRSALAELGPVKHVVSPNFEHTKFAAQWREAYPAAVLWACPGLPAKEPGVSYSRELGPADAAPPEWLGEIEALCLTFERNPFTGKPFFNEAVFLHKPTGFLLTSDLFWAYPSKGTQWGTQAWKFGMDKVYLPFYRRFMIKDKEGFQAATRRLLDEWQIRGIIPCHGDVVTSDGHAVLRRHLGL